MKKITFYFSITILLFLASCRTDTSLGTASDALDPSGTGQNNQSGLITAAEWNDLEEWQFWNELINLEAFADKTSYWDFYHNNRVSVQINNNDQPLVDAQVQLLNDGNIIWESRSDNYGKAEMWIDLFQRNNSVEISEYSLKVNGQLINSSLKLFSEGINEINLNTNQNVSEKVELNFIVDATSSMSDELEFIKDDLADVIQRVKENNSSLNIYTSSVFYRDEGDDYVVKSSDFTDDLSTTLDFIHNQIADGGGDFPEAVHSALKVGIEELQWSENAKTRIAFLLLDAPPHHDSQIIKELQNHIKTAAKKGIKIIPITASGIDKETEFLMRFFSISTNSTYVFITDDSGIGNDHLEPTVGEYEVEFLNDLMVRLISEYSE